MNKDELKKIIVEELKAFNKDMILNVAYFDDIADNIISKIPEPVITEVGIVEVLDDYYYNNHGTLSILEIKQIAKEILDKGEATSQK